MLHSTSDTRHIGHTAGVDTSYIFNSERPVENGSYPLEEISLPVASRALYSLHPACYVSPRARPY